MLHNNNELHRYKHVVKTVVGLCKLAIKLTKVKDQELAKLAPEFEAYKKSEEYEKLQKQINEIPDDDEENIKDTDPKGFQKYDDMVSRNKETLLGINTFFLRIVEWKSRLQRFCKHGCQLERLKL